MEKMEDFDKYKIFTPSFLTEEDEKNNNPCGYDWEWKPDTPQSVIDDYNDLKHYWNFLKE